VDFRKKRDGRDQIYRVIALSKKSVAARAGTSDAGRSAMMATSSVSNNVRESGKETREARKTALDTSGDIQSELQTLRDEFRLFAEQVGNIISDKGSAAWRRARPSIEGVVSDAQEKGREAVDAVREVTDNFVDAIDKSIENRPYTTLALFAVLGFMLGAIRHR